MRSIINFFLLYTIYALRFPYDFCKDPDIECFNRFIFVVFALYRQTAAFVSYYQDVNFMHYIGLGFFYDKMKSF